MIKKFYDHSTIFMEIRKDGTAGEVKRFHDWMLVSFNNVSGWTARPQRFLMEKSARGDNMCDVNFDKLAVWDGAGTYCEKYGNRIAIHGLCEMPVAYKRAVAEAPA